METIIGLLIALGIVILAFWLYKRGKINLLPVTNSTTDIITGVVTVPAPYKIGPPKVEVFSAIPFPTELAGKGKMQRPKLTKVEGGSKKPKSQTPPSTKTKPDVTPKHTKRKPAPAPAKVTPKVVAKVTPTPKAVAKVLPAPTKKRKPKTNKIPKD